MRNKLKNIIKYIFIFIFGGIFFSELVYAEMLFNALEVEYDNTNSGANSTDVQSAIDELYDLTENHCPDGYKCEIIPDVPDPVSFEDDSWETISNAVRTGNSSVYRVGDTKEVELGGYGTFTVRIANISTPTACKSTGFSQTACGFVVEFEELVTNYKMNSSNSNIGGWRDSEMRTFVNTTVYNALPNDLQNVIGETYVVSGHGDRDYSNFVTTDKLYLLSAKEVWGSGSFINTDSAASSTRQLDYYSSIGVSSTNYGGAIKYNSSKSAVGWWLRFGPNNYYQYFHIVYTIGDLRNNNASYGNVVIPAFRID